MPALLNTRGCSPRGYVRETRPVRGKSTNSVRPLTVGRVEVTGRFARLLLTVKTGNATDWRTFMRFCKFHGLNCEATAGPAGTHGGTTVFEVWGLPEALEEVQWLPCVVYIEQSLNTAPPRDKSALHSGMVDAKPKHCAPTVTKRCDGTIIVVSCKGVSYGTV